jgi:hypothetical protein
MHAIWSVRIVPTVRENDNRVHPYSAQGIASPNGTW